MFKVTAVRVTEKLTCEVAIYNPFFEDRCNATLYMNSKNISGANHIILIDTMEQLLNYLENYHDINAAQPQKVALENIAFSTEKEIETFLEFLRKVSSIHTMLIAIPNEKVFKTPELES